MAKPRDIPTNKNTENFSEMIESYSLKQISSDTPLEGYIIEFLDDKVVIDIGQKTEGILNKEELLDWNGEMNYKIGDRVSVICKRVNMKEGYVTVSKRQVDAILGWENAEKSYKSESPVDGRIIRLLDDHKGYMVDLGVEMFLPMSQADLKKVKNPLSLVGNEYKFKITKLNPRDKSGVVSRRVLLEEERRVKVDKLYDTLKVDDLVKGVVSTITDYGAFVNIGGVDGLIFKDNISYGRINHPREKLRAGDEVEAKILEIDKEKNRISLGLKQKYPDPWVAIETKYPLDKKLIAKVTKIVNFGAFIELEEGVEGLLHISDLTWEGKPDSVEEYVAVGDKLWVQVIEVDGKEKKIKLGLKQLEMRPEEKYLERHSKGEVIRGKVKKILKSKVFIELEKGVEGVLKISDISYFRIDSPEEFLTEKEPVDVMILDNIVDQNYKVKLGLKQLSDDEWTSFFRKNRSGSVIPVKLKKITDKGVSVEITKNIEGFIRLNEVEDQKITYEEVLEKYKPGDKHDVLILNADPSRKRVYLSFKAVFKKKEREEIEKYAKSSDDSVTTIGDLLLNEIKKKK